MEELIEKYREYEFVEFTEKNISDFYDLYQTVHNSNLSINHFELKTRTESLSGIFIVGYIAFDKKSSVPAAFYGVFPCKVRLDNLEVLCAQSGDTLTHPEHRRRGLFEHLFNLTKRRSIELGVKFLFGFPNSNSSPGFKKFGWEFYSVVRNLHLFYRRNYIERVRDRLFPSIVEIILKQHEIDLKSVDSYYLQSNIIRSKEYISYKSSLSNVKFYSLPSCIIWAKTDKNSFFLGDVFLKDNSLSEKAAKEILLFFKKLSFWNFYFSADCLNSILNELLKIEKFEVVESDLIITRFDLSLDCSNLRFSFVDFDTF